MDSNTAVGAEDHRNVTTERVEAPAKSDAPKATPKRKSASKRANTGKRRK